ncbi:MAG: DUF4325 domain-containing protein [Candidatus Dadabacteria bacterium]|nr:DUF4325 domain-containing protein [Candidatus Dadabacteria bacterium]
MPLKANLVFYGYLWVTRLMTMTDSEKKGQVEREGNVISIRGHADIDLLRVFLATVYQCSEEEHSLIILDFSLADFVHQQFMVSALPLLVKYRKDDKIQFTLKLPEQEEAEKLFRNANWAHFIAPEEFENSPLITETHLPATRFTNHDEQNKAVDDTLETLLNNYKFNKDQTNAIEWSLNEITDNVLTHAQSSIGGIVQVQGHIDPPPYIEFIVADAGIGIRQSLGMDNAEDALKRAIQEGVTRDSKDNAGNGLFGTYQVVTVSGGWFCLSSDKAQLKGNKESGMKTDPFTIPHTGTSVICRIDLRDPDLLEKALVFGGEKKEASGFYWKNRFSGNDDVMKFVMVKECNYGFGSRHSGRKAKNLIDNIIANTDNEVIEFDFEGVRIISSSFADEVFGRLFYDLGAVQFMHRIRFRNITPNNALLIDRAIAQRAAININNSGNKNNP